MKAGESKVTAGETMTRGGNRVANADVFPARNPSEHIGIPRASTDVENVGTGWGVESYCEGGVECFNSNTFV